MDPICEDASLPFKAELMHSAAAAVVLEKEESLMDAPSWTIIRGGAGAMPLQITGSVAAPLERDALP